MVAQSNREYAYAWAYAATSTESGYPSNIGYAHDKQPGGRAWYSLGDYHPARVDFTTTP